MKEAVRIIAILISVLSALALIFLLIGIVESQLELGVGIGLMVSLLWSVTLLWALDYALWKIDRLEKVLKIKGVITDKDGELKEPDFIEESAEENIYVCKNCGYQLFEDDDVCPNCKTPRDNNEER